MNPSQPPTVTIVVVPRDRFSCTEAALESIYANTPPIFDLIFVDAGSPRYIRDYLDAAALKYGFRLIRTDHYLSPNQARNLAVPHIKGRYVAFVDNDVVVTPHWLEKMVACADETGAGVVSPLIYVGEISQRIVHMAGGEMQWSSRGSMRWLDERHRYFNTPQTQIAEEFKRGPCDYAEFHCMLVRKTVLDRFSPLDEEMLSVAEHIDLSARSAEAGHAVWFEPDAHITFLATRPMALSDIPYFRLRWSQEWTERSLARYIQNWNLHPECSAVTGMRNFGITHLAGQQLPDEPDQIDALCAQTNVQLYDQCSRLGWRDEDLALLHRAYESSQRGFGHLYRSCGRPFLCHLIGTASLLAAHGATAQLVAAGMLHSTYTSGALAADGTGITPEKRQQVAGLFGPGVEYWIYLYAAFDWKGANIDELTANAERLVYPVAKTILIRLANDLEEYVSLSTRYSPQADDALRRWLPLYVEVARLLEMPQLIKRLNETMVAGATGLSAPLVLQTPKRASYSIE